MIVIWVVSYGGFVVFHLAIPVGLGTLLGWVTWDQPATRVSYAAALGWIVATIAGSAVALATMSWAGSTIVLVAGPIGALAGAIGSRHIERTPFAVPTVTDSES